MVTEDGLIILVKRIETRAADKDRAQRAERALERERDDLRARLITCQEGNRRNQTDLEEAHAKVEEWFNYSQAWAPLIPPRQRKELKATMPKPLETEIPF